jgi:rhodanese-related sulfurtransferase
MYMTQEEVKSLFENNLQHFLIVDTRDDDVAGGSIKGALHLADGSDWSKSIHILTKAITQKKATLVIFHCMESIRRGPRCARRVHNFFLDECEEDMPDLKILQGGADQWIRKFYETDLVEHYDDDYWGFSEFPPPSSDDRISDRGDSSNCSSVMAHPAPHALYVRPSDQHLDALERHC